jgi:DNA mismatch repair protein MSH5
MYYCNCYDLIILADIKFTSFGHKEFSAETGTMKLNAAGLINSDNSLLFQSQVAGGTVSIDGNYLSQCAAGGLLTYISSGALSNGANTSDQVDNDPSATTSAIIQNLWCLSFDDYMFISKSSLDALQVFDAKEHPNSNYQKEKESFNCLFGLFNHHIKTPTGSKLLKFWLRTPLTNVTQIVERQTLVGMLVENKEVRDNLQTTLRSLKGAAGCALGKKLGNAMLSLKDWQLLFTFASGCINLKDQVSIMINCFLSQGFHSDEYPPVLNQMLDEFDNPNFRMLVNEISATINWQSSREENRPVAKFSVDPTGELDKMREFYDDLDVYLQEMAEKILSEELVSDDGTPLLNKKIVGEVRGVYFPQLGFLISVPIHFQRSGQLAHLTWDGSEENKTEYSFLEEIFTTETHAFFKTGYTREFDNDVGDIYSKIVDREVELFFALQENLVKSGISMKDFTFANHFTAELDVLCAMASAAVENGYSRPLLLSKNDDDYANIIKIVQGRHPIMERITGSFVPNNTLLISGSENSSHEVKNVELVTGPNASGKSVYLCQIGLIVLMAQIGSFVPATECVLSPKHALFTRIATTESVSLSTSAFMSDLNDISLALRLAEQDSLVLMDEFGKGTTTRNGIALLVAVLHYFSTQVPASVVAITHFHEIYQINLVAEFEKRIKFSHLNTLLSDQSGSQEGELTFLYEVTEGREISSHGLYCAKIAGISSDILSRAKQISSEMVGIGAKKIFQPAEFHLQDLRDNGDLWLRIYHAFQDLNLESASNEELDQFLSDMKEHIQ